MNKRIGLLTAGLVAGLVMVGGTAFAVSSSIPDAQGVIHGCYDSGGSVKVIDTSVTAHCPKGYTALNWNQTGPAGAGATVTPLASGNSSCPNGGAEIQDGNNPPGTAYACNGTNGSNGTNAEPEFTWTASCPSGNCRAGIVAATPIPAGTVLTPVSITVTGGTCPDGYNAAIAYDNFGNILGQVQWGAWNYSTSVSGPDTISAANSNVGPLVIDAHDDCGTSFTVTFTFDEMQSYS